MNDCLAGPPRGNRACPVSHVRAGAPGRARSRHHCGHRPRFPGSGANNGNAAPDHAQAAAV